jgi:hypothetical protein
MRDVGPSGHAHRYHHLGKRALRAMQELAQSRMAPPPKTPLRRQLPHQLPLFSLALDANPMRHAGVLQSSPTGRPAFFHRTSFNGKFFPDCPRQERALREPRYCEPQWVTVPLEDAQAVRALKKEMYAWDENDIDTEAYKAACTATTSGSSAGSTGNSSRRADSGGGSGAGGWPPAGAAPAGQRQPRQQRSQQRRERWRRRQKQAWEEAREAAGLQAPEAGCNTEALGLGEARLPVPALPVARLGPRAAAVLAASYEAYAEVRAVLEGGGQPASGRR